MRKATVASGSKNCSHLELTVIIASVCMMSQQVVIWCVLLVAQVCFSSFAKPQHMSHNCRGLYVRRVRKAQCRTSMYFWHTTLNITNSMVIVYTYTIMVVVVVGLTQVISCEPLFLQIFNTWGLGPIGSYLLSAGPSVFTNHTENHWTITNDMTHIELSTFSFGVLWLTDLVLLCTLQKLQ